MEPETNSIQSLGRKLADTLAEGWSRARPDVIMSIFADDPVFIETPYSEPISGFVPLREWFSDIPYSQSEPKFTVGEIFTVGPWFSTEFKLSFRRRKTGEMVEARGALFAETEGEKISELRMYWHRWNGGRETSLP